MGLIIKPATIRVHASIVLAVTTEIAGQKINTDVPISGTIDPERQQLFVEDIEALLAKYKDPDEIPF